MKKTNTGAKALVISIEADGAKLMTGLARRFCYQGFSKFSTWTLYCIALF
jgi:hypothetical protein